MSRTIRVGDRVTCAVYAGTYTVVRMIRGDRDYFRRAVIRSERIDVEHTVAADTLRFAPAPTDA